MLKKEFERQDKTKGYNYIPEVDDIVVSKSNSPWKSDPKEIIKDDKKISFHNYGLKVEFENEEIFIRLTKNQFNQLENQEDLFNKPIQFVEYKNTYGSQIGVKIL